MLAVGLALPSGLSAQLGSDQDAARAATDSGLIRPLPEILATVERKVPGRVVDVQLDKSGKPWTYRIKVLNDQGNVVSVAANAETGQILTIQGQR